MKNEEILKLPFGELLDEYKSLTGMSANKLGACVGVSGSQLSQIRKGTYKDVDQTENKVREFIKNELEKKATKTFKAVKIEFEYIQKARGRMKGILERNKLVLLRGDSGTGKSTYLRELEQENPNSFMIQAYKGMKKSELIDEIYKGLGVNSKSKNMSDIIPRIKNRILIIDEANKLSGGTLEWLRSLHDRSVTSMVWAGTYEDITEVLSKQSELNRRCKKIYMDNLKKFELKRLVQSYELKDVDYKTDILWDRFNGAMGLSVEVLKDIKEYVLNTKMPDDELTMKTMLELME